MSQHINTKQLMFLHIPKTAGQSINVSAHSKGLDWKHYASIQKYLSDRDLKYHWSIKHLIPKTRQEFLDKYDLFSVVREPYDRMLSIFFFTYNQYNGSKDNHIFGKPKPNLTVEEFNQLIIQALTEKKFSSVFYPQSYWLTDEHGKMFVKHIIRFESLISEFKELCESYKIYLTLDHLNSSKRMYSVKDLFPETIAIINEYYKDDFMNFGYPMKTVK